MSTTRIRRHAARASVGVVVAGMLAGLVAGVGPGMGGAAAEVQLEPVSSAGPSPFMSPVGRDRANLSSPAGAGGEYVGDTAGLYADTGSKPSCDARGLLTNLQADPARATAWSTALGITAGDITSFVASLTPVVLRADTAITSHGYQDGAYTAYLAVLQAGTAVFVNSHGEPTVKCYSGNPLTKGANHQQASYRGPAWQSFQPQSVTVIQPTPTVINNYTFVNVDNGRPITRPGKPHPKPHPGPGPKEPGPIPLPEEPRPIPDLIPDPKPSPMVPAPDGVRPTVPGPRVPAPDGVRPTVPGPRVPAPDGVRPTVPGPRVPAPDGVRPTVPGPTVPPPEGVRPTVPSPKEPGPREPRPMPPSIPIPIPDTTPDPPKLPNPKSDRILRPEQP